MVQEIDYALASRGRGGVSSVSVPSQQVALRLLTDGPERDLLHSSR